MSVCFLLVDWLVGLVGLVGYIALVWRVGFELRSLLSVFYLVSYI